MKNVPAQVIRPAKGNTLVWHSAGFIGLVGGAAAHPLPSDVRVPSLADVMARAPRRDDVDRRDQNIHDWERRAVQTRRGYL